MSEDVVAPSQAGAGFEAVLANVALRGIGALIPPRTDIGRLARALVRRPEPAARRIAGLAARLAQVGIGVDDKPGDVDRRFADRAWAENPALQRLALGYLATCDAAASVLDEADLDWRTRERLRLPIDNFLAALAPTNTLLLNPASWKECIDTGGGSLISGLNNLVSDLRSPAKLPASVDRSAFRLGENVAATAGKVVRRTRIYELIEYEPRTDTVDAVPVVMVPSPVNKFYLLDLDPPNSVMRAELERGRRAFALSWINPDETHADVGFDEYVTSIVEALETACEIGESPNCHLLGLCGGGVLVFMTAAYLAAVGRQDLLATLTIGIAVIDFDRGPSTMAFLDAKGAERAVGAATKRGYFDARNSARSFALIRPVDGIWSSAVNNYLLGKKPPAVALLQWASDQTNIATKYGAQMMRTALENGLVRPGGVTVLGQPLDPGQITVDTYVLGASTDHISPWQDCYRTVALVGGPVEFVLARGGHVVVVAKGPGSSRASYRTGDIRPSAEQWLADSADNQGSWWEHWNEWVEKRTPRRREAPARTGSDSYPPLADAPGEYVMRVLT